MKAIESAADKVAPRAVCFKDEDGSLKVLSYDVKSGCYVYPAREDLLSAKLQAYLDGNTRRLRSPLIWD
jgi:hypothetical protein